MLNKFKTMVENLQSDVDCATMLTLDECIHAVLGINGEAGEIADLFKKILTYGKPVDVGLIIEECGDLLHYVQMLLNQFDVSMEECLQANIDKLAIRYPDGFTKPAANNRDKVKEQKVFDKFRK